MNQRNRTLSQLGLIVVAAAALGSTTGLAQAQNALGDGNVLANPLDVYQAQLFSESRTERFQRETRFRNAIVTGRAAGGLSFRGDAGYGSALEFRGELGSDVTYAFRRDSAISGLAAQGISGTDALRFQFALSTGSSLPPGYTGSGIIARNPSRILLSPSAFSSTQLSSAQPMRHVALGDRTYQELADAGATLRADARDLRSVAGLIGQRSLNPSTVQTVDLGLGRQSYDVVASPTAGVRMRPIDSPLVLGGIRPQSTALRTAEPSPGSLSAINRLLVRRPGDALTLPTIPEVPNAADPVMDPGVTDPATTPTPATDPLEITLPTIEDPEDGLLAPDRLDALRAWLSGDEAGVDGDALLLPDEILLLRGAPRVEELIERKSGLEMNAAYVLHMARGQSLLSEQRYFDAEERFVTALSILPNDPTALIGRVHAQLGAGLLLSASNNLRDVMTLYPELVGVRYAPNLMPDSDRLESLLKELGFAKDLPLASTGLMRAYVGYQSENRDLVLEGLDQLRSGSRSDLALAKLLGEVWLADDEP